MNTKEYLISCLIEELAEVQKELVKCLRFTPDHVSPHDQSSNIARAGLEYADAIAIIEMLEADLVKTEEEITKLEVNKNATSREAEAVDIHKVVAYVKYFMEHLHELLLDLCNPTLKAQYFSVLFDKAPTFEEIKAGTQKESVLPEVNELFSALNVQSSLMVISRGIEPRLPG